MKSPLHEYQSPFVELMVLCWWINPFQTVFVTMKVWMEKANLQLCSRNQWARWAVMDATGWDNGGTGRCLGQAVSYNSKCYDHGEWQKERNKWLHLGQSFAFKVSLAPPPQPSLVDPLARYFQAPVLFTQNLDCLGDNNQAHEHKVDVF